MYSLMPVVDYRRQVKYIVMGASTKGGAIILTCFTVVSVTTPLSDTQVLTFAFFFKLNAL